jgi:hypothetical protein
MKIQEAIEDLQMGGILFPKFRGKLFEDEDLKTMENRRLGQETDSMRLGLGKMPSSWI